MVGLIAIAKENGWSSFTTSEKVSKKGNFRRNSFSPGKETWLLTGGVVGADIDLKGTLTCGMLSL